MVTHFAEHGGMVLEGIPESLVTPPLLSTQRPLPHCLPCACSGRDSGTVATDDTVMWLLQEGNCPDAVIAKKGSVRGMESLLARVTGIPVLKPSFVQRYRSW